MEEKEKELLLIALGGNALVESGKKGTISDHLRSIQNTCDELIPLFEKDYDIVITHGNGPQVGNILIQNEETAEKVPSMPLDVCVAESQGEIGYLLQQTLKNKFKDKNIKKDVVTLITQVMVDKNDIAFEKPSKPVGPYYTQEQAQSIIKHKKWTMHEDPSGKGFRRVVPSPKPAHILETRVIRQLLLLDQIPIAVGGGGIPVYMSKDDSIIGVEAVIDKDLASAQLAIEIKADKFIILTNVKQCYLNYKKRTQVPIFDMNLDEAHTYLDQGQFSSGSMGPKVQAAIEYITNGGKEAYITDIKNIQAAIDKESGTFIHH
jgi:carbamate kinase